MIKSESLSDTQTSPVSVCVALQGTERNLYGKQQQKPLKRKRQREETVKN